MMGDAKISAVADLLKVLQDSKPGTELVGEIQQAAQQAPDAIEVQRIPKAARDMAKGYFKNLGGQKEDGGKEAPKEEPKR